MKFHDFDKISSLIFFKKFFVDQYWLIFLTEQSNPDHINNLIDSFILEHHWHH